MPSSTMNRVIRRTLTNQYRRQTQARSGVSRPARAVQVNGAGVVSVAGQALPASGINAPAGSQVAVRNVGRLSNAMYVPDNASSIVYTSGSIGGSGGGGGGTYLPGDGINIVGSTISVNAAQIVDAASPFIISSGNIGLLLRVPSGLVQDGTGIAVRPKADSSLGIDANGLFVIPRPSFGLFNNAAGLGILKPAISGLILDATGIRVGEGDGIDVLSTTVAVNTAEITDTAFGLTTSSNNMRINVTGNTGLLFVGGGALGLGTPSTLSVSGTNHVTSTTHGHAVTTSSDVGSIPARAILASTVSGELTLGPLNLYGNLTFMGADRFVYASNNLTLRPFLDLVLHPEGNVRLPIAQQVITDTYNDFVAGITGFRHFHVGGNVRQITVGKIKADELHVRAFVADVARVSMGAEFWAKSRGIVQEQFTILNVELNHIVWFEELPDLGTFALFEVGDWILIRTIDWGTGLIVQAIWFQIVAGSGAPEGWVQREAATATQASRQQWALKRKSGGFTGEVVKPGAVAVDFGVPRNDGSGIPGQGVVHLSALDEDGGPFIEVQRFDSVLSNVPQFKPLVRMGHLSGYAGLPAGRYGFGASADGSVGWATGNFSGMLVDQVDGLRLFNVDLALYDGSTKILSFNKDTGLTIDFDIAEDATWGRYIRWQDNVNVLDGDSSVSFGGYKDAGHNVGYLRVSGSSGTEPYFKLLVEEEGNPFYSSFQLRTDSLIYDSITNGFLRLAGQRMFFGGQGSAITASTFHVHENTSATGTDAGVTIQQAGGGDAVLQWLRGTTRFFAGIDATDGNWKLASGSHLGSGTQLSIDPTTGYFGLNIAVPTTILDVRGAGAIRHIAPSSSGGIVFQHIIDTDGSNSFARMVVAHNAIWDFSDNLWKVEGIGANDTSAFLVENGGSMRWIVHGNTGNFDRTFTHSNFVASGTRMYLSAGGNWAISGSASIGAMDSSPAERLSVIGGNIQIDNGMWYKALLADGATDIRVFGIGGDNIGYFGGIDAGLTQVRFRTGGTDRLTITSTGSVGIGTITPGQNVVGATDLDSTPGTTVLHFDGTRPRLLLRGSDYATFDMIDSSWATANQKWFSLIHISGETRFRAISDDGTERFRFMTMEHVNGHIGIYNDAPGTKLDVFADTSSVIRATSFSSFYSFIARRANGSTLAPTQVTNGQIVGSLAVAGYTSSGWTGNHSAEFDAVAVENFTAGAQGTKWRLWVTKAGGTVKSIGMDIGDDRQAFFPGIDAHVTANAANVNVETSSGFLRRSTSARRYKTDIRPLPDQADLITKLNPVLYKPAKGVGGEGRDFPGLIAEEVLAAGGRDFVTFNGRGEAEYVMYDRLIVLAIREIQALRQEVSMLKRRLN